MGVAILWIVLYHSGIDFGKIGIISHTFSVIKNIGYIGVDIFFFVSGFGLMTSWCKKRPSVLLFYKRRFLRIMPIYWFFFSIYLIFLALFGKFMDLGSIFLYYTGFAFFINNSTLHWFVSAILLSYLIFPFFAKNFIKSEQKFRFITMITIFCLFTAIFLSLSALFFENKFSFLLIIVLRLPSFFIGSLLGYIYIEKDNNYSYLFSLYRNIFFTFFCFITLLLVYCFFSPIGMWLYGLYWYPFALGSFSLTYLLSILLKIIHTYFKPLILSLGVIGKSSFELYFIHLLVFQFIGSTIFLKNVDPFFEGRYIMIKWILSMFFSVAISIIFNLIISYFSLNVLKKNVRQNKGKITN